MRFLILAVLILGGGLYTDAQTTISPAMVEGTGGTARAKGQVLVQNGSIKPSVILIEVHGLVVDSTGRPRFIPLPSNISIDVSETSFRLGAKQSKYVNYTVDGHGQVAYGVIDIITVVGSTDKGIQIRIDQPSSFYVCPKGTKGSCRDYVRKNVFHLDK